MAMQALFLKDGQIQYQTDYAKPIPQMGEALIELFVAGICATDIEVIRGYKAGFTGVLGHEFVGRVVEVASAEDNAWVGRRVVGTINVLPEIVAGKTADEIEKLAKHDPQRAAIGIFGRDGVFADYIALPIQNLWEVPAGVSDEEAVFTEPLAAALEIREQVSIRPDMKVAVIGSGRLGMLCGAVLAMGGTEVTMLGRRPSSLVLAQKWGLQTGLATEMVDSSFDLIVEATGNETGLAQAIRLIRPQGTIVLKSTFAGKTSFDLVKIVVSEIQLVGSRCGPFAPALRLLAQKGIPVVDMIDGRYTLRAGHEALVHAGQSGVRKILLTP